ncbi:MAG: sulfotransferase [Gammaproteobacteria bacterium]
MIDRLKDPIFFIGFPRSGTTIIFEAFVRNPEFGWLANYAELWPRAIAANILCRLLDNRLVRLRGHKKQYSSVRFGNRYLPQPVEAYAFWDYFTGIDFSHDYVIGQKADKATCHRVRDALLKTMWYQGKMRFTTKFTGPGRIGYLRSIFPDARFVHVIRDGRAVVESLLRTDFWHAKGGMEAPFWNNGLEVDAIADWERSDRDPVVLAAHQWRRIIETTRDESRDLDKERYFEVKYENFVRSSQSATGELLLWASIDRNTVESKGENNWARLDDMNVKYLEVFGGEQIAAMNRIMGPMLMQLGYII